MRLPLVVLPVVVMIAGCAPTTLTPLTVPLEYKMMASAVEMPSLEACSGVSSVQISDGRREQAIGTRFLQEQREQTFPVTATGDVAAWARAAVEGALRTAKVSTASASADRPALVITVEEIRTEENIYRRAEYDASVVLNAELRSGARSCWRERVDGFAENYGYAGSAVNYQETINHALDRALIRMLNNNAFREAVCKPCR
jgi:hypothetical protein